MSPGSSERCLSLLFLFWTLSRLLLKVVYVWVSTEGLFFSWLIILVQKAIAICALLSLGQKEGGRYAAEFFKLMRIIDFRVVWGLSGGEAQSPCPS